MIKHPRRRLHLLFNVYYEYVVRVTMSRAVDQNQNIIIITLCVLEVTGLARLAVSRSLMRPGRGHFFLGARLVSVTSRSTGADCTLANFFANISNIAAANIALEGEAVL